MKKNQKIIILVIILILLITSYILMKRTKDTFEEGKYLSGDDVESEYYLSPLNSLEFHNLKRDRHMYWSSYRIEEESNLGNLVNLKEGDEDEFKYRRLSNKSGLDDLKDHSTIIFGSMIISNTNDIQATLNNIEINDNSLSTLLTNGLSDGESNTIKIYEYDDTKKKKFCRRIGFYI